MQNALKSNEWTKIWVHRTSKIEIPKRGTNNSDILQNWFLQKLGNSSLISINFNTLRKVLLNHEEHIEMEWMTKNLTLENF